MPTTTSDSSKDAPGTSHRHRQCFHSNMQSHVGDTKARCTEQASKKRTQAFRRILGVDPAGWSKTNHFPIIKSFWLLERFRAPSNPGLECDKVHHCAASLISYPMIWLRTPQYLRPNRKTILPHARPSFSHLGNGIGLPPEYTGVGSLVPLRNHAAIRYRNNP